MLGNSESLFPQQLCAQWRKRGVDVTLVTRTVGEETHLPDGTPIVRVMDYSKVTRRNWRMRKRMAKLDEWIARRHFKHYEQATGRKSPMAWEYQVYPQIVEGVATARAVRQMQQQTRIDFVFAQELFSYGLAGAMCWGIPKFMFPWGADVMWCPELSPISAGMVGWALRSAELILPASVSAAAYIQRRFGLPAERVRALSWGVDVGMFKPLEAARRAAVCDKWKIPTSARVFLNARRLLPEWGSLDVFEAFFALAKETTGTHFVLLGGDGTEKTAAELLARVTAANLAHRFTIIQGRISLQECAELMGIAEVFTSVMGSGDMRSSSVLQAAAAGGAPLLGAYPEYELMARQGFRCLFAQLGDVPSILEGLRAYARSPELCAELSRENRAYLEAHEDFDKQMDLMLATILRRVDARPPAPFSQRVAAALKHGALQWAPQV